MAGHRESKSSREKRSDEKSSSNTGKPKSKSSSSSGSNTKISKHLQSSEEPQEYPEDPVTPKPIQDPYPDGPPIKPKSSASYSSGFPMSSTYRDPPRAMADYSTSANSPSGYGPVYSSNINPPAHYPPSYQGGYTMATDSTSTNTAASGQQQYSYTPSYQSYEMSGNGDSQQASDQRR